MQHDDVMARLCDRHMKLRVQLRFVICVTLLMCGFHLVENRLNDPKVGVRTKPRGPFGCQPFHVAAERKIVEHGFVVTCKKLCQGRGERAAEHIGDIDPRAGL